MEIAQRHSKTCEHVVYKAIESLTHHTGSRHASSFSCLKLFLGSFTWWTSSLNCSLNSLNYFHPQSGRQWEDSLAFPSWMGSLHTYMCVYIYIFTCISSKWGLGDLKGQNLNTCFYWQDREKNTWAWDKPLPAAEEHEKLTAPAEIPLPDIIK